MAQHCTDVGEADKKNSIPYIVSLPSEDPVCLLAFGLFFFLILFFPCFMFDF
jgi:hypothetical protein